MDVKNPAQPQDPVSQPAVLSTPEQPSGAKPKLSKWIIPITAVLVLAAAGGTTVHLLNKNLTAKIQNTQTAVSPTVSPTAIPPMRLQSTPTPASALTPTSTFTPTPIVDEESLLKTVIKEALVAKFGSDGSSLTITVSQIDGNYAKGGATEQGGGGMWFAAKVNGAWKLVWDGNGVILCSDLTAYPDFPSVMIPECWNEVTQKTVQR